MYTSTSITAKNVSNKILKFKKHNQSATAIHRDNVIVLLYHGDILETIVVKFMNGSVVTVIILRTK